MLSSPGLWSRSALARITVFGAIFVAALMGAPAVAQSTSCLVDAAPSVQFGELFREVQMKGIFHDSKTFADMHYDESAEEILVDYHKHKNEPEFDLKAFVQRHFTVPNERPTVAPAEGSQSVDGYIANLWDVLRQQTDEGSGHSSLLPLPHPYVVPGGRFRELYYWDSYFTMLGLEAHGRHDLVRDMIQDFAFEIDCTATCLLAIAATISAVPSPRSSH